MITAIKNESKSCPFGKHFVYDLSNGWEATVEYLEGIRCDSVTRLEKGDEFWHCSNGKKELPDFAKPWVDEKGNLSVGWRK